MSLQSHTPEHLSYSNDLLQIDILGGIKIEGLDRMRATLKVALIDRQVPPVRHNLDLYNDNQLEKFIRKCAERLELGTVVIAAAMAELTEALEAYRLERIKEQTEAPQIKPFTDEDFLDTVENLKHKDLLNQTLEDLKSTGIIGEEDNAMILYLAMTSRKTKDPISVICLAKSGTGKSYLMEKVAACMPQEEIREHTQFSGNSFYYYRRDEIKSKVFLIEDLDGAEAVMFPIRELQTKKKISKTVTVKDSRGQLRTVTLVVEGPVSVIGCTTREKIYEDNANRALLIYLDNSAEQTKRIMQYQKQVRAGLVDLDTQNEICEKLQNMQRALQPVRIINPYAPLIDLPKEIFKPRRTLPLLLSFIEAITFYHQYQREEVANEETGEIFIATHPDDIEHAFRLLREVLFKKADELSGAIRDFYEWVASCDRQFYGQQFFGRDIRKEKRTPPRTLRRYLKELTEYGFLEITGGAKHKTGYSYQVVKGMSYAALQQSIDAQINGVLQVVREAHQTRRQKTDRPRQSRKKKPGQVGQPATVGQTA